MSLFWVRKGNFFEKIVFDNPDIPLQNQVEFEDPEPSAVITLITLSKYSDEDFRIDLQIAPRFFDELGSICKALFPKSDLQIAGLNEHSIKIILNCDATKYDYFQKNLEIIFEKYNKEKIIFPIELINEIRQVITLLKQKSEERNWKRCKHFLPEETIALSHINPEKEGSYELVDLFGKKNNFSMIKLNEGLVWGENPNQFDIGGFRLGVVFVMHANDLRSVISEEEIEDILDLLTGYGVEYFNRHNRFIRLSAFDEAFIKHDTKIINYLSNLLSSLGKSLKIRDLIPAVTIDKILFSFDETNFVFKNNITIKVKFIPICELTPTQKKECFFLFKKYFKDPQGNGSRTLAAFEDSFAVGEDRFVEMIYLCNETTQWLSGINLREAWKSNVVPNHGVVHGIYCYMEPELRRYGLSDILAFSEPPMMQMLYPNHTFVFIYSPTTYQAYLMLKIALKLLHAPKYQSPLVKMLINEFISKVYNDEVEVVHKHMTWGVKEKFPLVSMDAKSKNQKQQPLKKFYDKWIAAGNYPLVLFHASKQSVKELSDSAERLGFDFKVYAKFKALFFKRHAEKIMKKPALTVNPDYNFKEESALFWKSTHLRSRL